MKNPVIGIAGWSGSGKTTLLEYLLPRLATQGLRVNVVKHSHHARTPDAQHKDSFRLQAAGAVEVLVASQCGADAPVLNELLMRLAPAHLTLVEGFKQEPIPKLEIYRPGLGEPALYPNDITVLAVATDAAPPPILRKRLIWLDINQPAQVLAWLQVYIGHAYAMHAGDRYTVSNMKPAQSLHGDV